MYVLHKYHLYSIIYSILNFHNLTLNCINHKFHFYSQIIIFNHFFLEYKIIYNHFILRKMKYFYLKLKSNLYLHLKYLNFFNYYSKNPYIKIIY